MRKMTEEPDAVQEWAWLIDAFADCGLSGGRLLTNPLGQVELDLDLGDAWGATQHPSFKEGYFVEWLAEPDTPPHVPAIVAPLLLRLKQQELSG